LTGEEDVEVRGENSEEDPGDEEGEGLERKEGKSEAILEGRKGRRRTADHRLAATELLDDDTVDGETCDEGVVSQVKVKERRMENVPMISPTLAPFERPACHGAEMVYEPSASWTPKRLWNCRTRRQEEERKKVSKASTAKEEVK